MIKLLFTTIVFVAYISHVYSVAVSNIITLPVVVHVVHSGTPIGSADNPSDSLIHELIDLMNEAFQLNGPQYGGADMEIAFQLASRSPLCDSTSGINRVDGSVFTDYPTGGITNHGAAGSVDEVLVKGLSRWPNTDYINIWIVNRINGDPFSPGGYAYFPEYNSALTDGIVLQASVVNGTNKTVIHELGHYFSLYHIFEGQIGMDTCTVNNNCEFDGDRICDTEPCLFTTNCNEPLNACTEDDWAIADSIHGYTVLNNYMGFTNCQWMFTEDQKARVYDALFSFRPGLLSSTALSDSTEMVPASACIPTAMNSLSFSYGIERVEFGILNVYSNTSAADGSFYVDRTCNQRISVAAGDSVSLRITGSYQSPQQIRVYLDLNDNGVFELPGETMLSMDGGVVHDTIVIPLMSVSFCTPLRMRVVAEPPMAPSPTPCLLTGTIVAGVGQIEDYTVIITPRIVESIGSGDWDDPVVWSCNCIPGISDLVIVKADHEIAVTPLMGTIECIEVELEPGAVLNVDGDLRIKGGCE